MEMKTYVTFGQTHVHRINNKTLDKDCVAVIEAEDAKAGREKAFEYFGPSFFTTYTENQWDDSKLQWFPRGLIHLT